MKSAHILVVGGDRGLGNALLRALIERTDDNVLIFTTSRKNGSDSVKELVRGHANVRLISNLDITDEAAPESLVKQLDGTVLGEIYHVAGLFTSEGQLGVPGALDRDGQRKMYEVCAIGPLFLWQALVENNLIQEQGGKILFVTSEGGSISLRTLKEGGKNYGHHGSKCAANMVARLAAFDLHSKGIAVLAVHPGFVRTEMTEKYKQLYETLGALPANEMAPLLIDQMTQLTMEKTGLFVSAASSQNFGYGVFALPIKEQYEADFGPGQRLPY